jgi:hypothetical protein
MREGEWYAYFLAREAWESRYPEKIQRHLRQKVGEQEQAAHGENGAKAARETRMGARPSISPSVGER